MTCRHAPGDPNCRRAEYTHPEAYGCVWFNETQLMSAEFTADSLRHDTNAIDPNAVRA